jgi:hypothetical protein
MNKLDIHLDFDLDPSWIDEEEDYFTTTIHINNVPHHLQGVRVTDKDEHQVPTKDPYGRFNDVCHLYDYFFMTTTFEGVEGEWVLYLHPHAQ